AQPAAPASAAGSRGPGLPRPVPDLDTLARDLGDVEVALQRLDEGSYGTCEACGTELHADVVVAFPATRRCPGHGGPVAQAPAS
ncbi:MAG: hypothetical protein M3Y91_17195, partial [Actinomycetota bacterium]|nr:hypothetical protein [Actinomycetota bacterium]